VTLALAIDSAPTASGTISVRTPIVAPGRVGAIFAAIDRTAGADLWPGYDLGRIPIMIDDGTQTWLARHPSPPEGFAQVPGVAGLLSAPGRRPEMVANTSIVLAGVGTATLMDDGTRAPADLACLAAHEGFHVFQRARHADWMANEADLFGYPAGDAAALAGRRLEWAALRRATSAVDFDAAACWAQVAVDERRHRFEALGAPAAAYERGTELNEGLATYVEARARAVLSPADDRHRALPPEEFPPDGVRQRGYLSGLAFGRLLDRMAPGWRTTLESGPTRPLDQILASALAAQASVPAAAAPPQAGSPAASAPAPGPPCSFSAAEIDAASARALQDVAALEERLAALEREVLGRPGWRIVVEAAAAPLRPRSFDPLNVRNLGGGSVLHTRYLDLEADSGTIEVLGRDALTVAVGPHPLFGGLRRVTVTGLAARPAVTQSDDGVTLTAEKVTMRFAAARIIVEGETIVVTLDAPAGAAP
jgi:hypothetical protein